MFGTRTKKQRIGRRPDHLSSLADGSLGCAIWERDDSADIRIGEAFKPRDGGSLVVKSTFRAENVDRYIVAFTQVLGALSNNSSWLDPRIKERLRWFAEATEHVTDLFDKSDFEHPRPDEKSGLFT